MDIDFSNATHVTTKNMDTYKATVTVGKDTIEAEYYTFESVNLKRENNTFKDKLENLWFYISMPFWKTKHWIRDAYWEVLYGLQRMFKDYDSVDTFNTFNKFIERYTKILTEYKKHHCGYCAMMTEEEWDNIIDEMIYHLYYMDEEHITNELEKSVPDDWNAKWTTVNYILDKHKDEFFKLFSEYFYYLWD